MALPIAATIAGAAYLNAKYHIYKDINYLVNFKRAERQTTNAAVAGRSNIFYLLEEIVSQRPASEIALWSRNGCYTWAEVLHRTCQYGNYFSRTLGLRANDVVALYLTNEPEFIFVWYGLLAVGVAPAFINYNLASDALVHCVKLSGAKVLLVDEAPECQGRVRESMDRLTNGELRVEILDFTKALKGAIARDDTSRPDDSLRKAAEGKIPAAFIYTSGTTGLAKAIPVPMVRVYLGGLMFRRAKWRLEGDRWYICMPMYHGTAALGSAQCMLSGMSVALGKKFSTRNFWNEVRDSDSTGFIYVGETARYLLAAPPSPNDKNHNARMMFGNGMRPDVWPRFVERFGVSEVCEFFNSTEGMLGLAVYTRNSFGQGSVGHHGLPFRLLMHGTLVPVKLDSETGTMYRDPKTGFAIRQPYEKGGEILVKVPDRSGFPGYHKSKAQTDKMFATDVFKKGDLYFKSGDALRRDRDGLWYFLDRLGDTFRWKGENVSTAEVAEVLGKYKGVHEANVYGIALPNHDGRAGCAALNLEKGSDFDSKGIATYSRAELPRYAVPVFIRILTGDVGGLSSHNHKQDKVKLRGEGVDPSKIGSQVLGSDHDEIWWLPPGNSDGGYVKFEKTDWDRIVGGKAKL